MAAQPSPIPYADAKTPKASAYRTRLLGQTHGDFLTAQLVESAQRIDIRPIPVPTRAIVQMFLALLAICGCIVAAIYCFAPQTVDRKFVLIAGSVASIFTAGLPAAITAAMYQYSVRRGGWLHVDRLAQTLCFCRRNRVVPLATLVRLEHLRLYGRDWKGRITSDGDRDAEIHAILRGSPPEEERVLVLTGLGDLLKQIARELASKLDVPLIEVFEHRNGEIDVNAIRPSGQVD